MRYAEAYNSGALFVKDSKTNLFVFEKDVAQPSELKSTQPLSERAIAASEAEYTPAAKEIKIAEDTAFHQFMHSPARLTLPGNEKGD